VFQCTVFASKMQFQCQSAKLPKRTVYLTLTCHTRVELQLGTYPQVRTPSHVIIAAILDLISGSVRDGTISDAAVHVVFLHNSEIPLLLRHIPHTLYT
jgi:hypothetical protein